MGRPRKEKPIETEIKVLNVGDLDTIEQKDNTPAESESTNIVTLVISHVNLTAVIGQAFYLGKLGGKLTPRFLPRLKSPPYTIKVDLTPEAFEQYGRNDGLVEYDESEKYTEVIIRSVDPLQFMNAVLEVGAKGGILSPKKTVSSGLTMRVQAVVKGNIESSPLVNVLPSK